MKKGIIVIMMLFMVFAVSVPVRATVILDSWTMNLSGVDGLVDPTIITDIQQIAYYGIAHSQTTDTNANGLPDAGEYGTTDGLLTTTQLIDSNGAIILPGVSGIGVNYEMTFDFSVDSFGVDPATHGGLTFQHLAPSVAGTTTDGLMDIWIDTSIDSATGTGAGYTDGEKIATFRVVSGDGGTFTPGTYDGNDDATFELIWAMSGVFFDGNGNDIGEYQVGDPLVLITITDSNFDGDPNDLGSFSVPNPTANPGFLASGTPIDFNALEDGSARLGVIPEPATMLLLGSGLIGLGVFGRRKKKI